MPNLIDLHRIRKIRRLSNFLTKNKEELLESILNIEIKEITVNKDVTLDVEDIDGKIGIMDITAKLNINVMVNIEMQVENEYNIVERSLFYWSRNVLFKFKKRERLQRLYENNSNCNNGF